MDGPPFPEKGDLAEGAYARPGRGILGRRRICGVLSRMWSAICVVSHMVLNLHHKRVSLRGTVVCGVFGS